MGTKIQNGIGGSGDFARSLHLLLPHALGGEGRRDLLPGPEGAPAGHTEHDVHVIVTEQGLADLRGLSKARAKQIIERCAHPDYRPALRESFQPALELSPGKQAPHLLEESLGWHVRYLRKGTMRQ